jgi:hypothetical protein
MKMAPKRGMCRVAGLFYLALFAVPVVTTAQVPAPAAAKAPTFTKDVAPILQRSCQLCHRPGSIAPMSLLTYDDARPWAKSIKQKVSARDMPPWFIDRNIGIRKFKNNTSLSDAEIATIVDWVDGGAIMGNPADMPPALQFPDANAWQNGPPDLVVEMPGEVIVKAHAPDWWGNVQTEGPIVTEDRWIKAAEDKPIKGYRVMHHGTASIIDPSDAQEGSAADGFGAGLVEYSIGKNGDVYPEGTGRLLKAGSRINWNLHLHADGEETPAKVALGLQFYPRGYVPKHVLRDFIFGGDNEKDLDIPAGADNVRFDTYVGVSKPTVLTAFEPHMHARGKAECLEAIYPPGTTGSNRRNGGVTTETLSCVDRFNFGWLRSYEYADDVAPVLPAGTILHVITWHNNSTSNKQNYDPTNWIGFGNRTIDDMSHVWVGAYEISQEEYEQRIAERKAKRSN